jgi:predicted transcriptional regulator
MAVTSLLSPPTGYNGCDMPETSTRERIIAALRDLPEDATFEDAIERLVFLAKIEQGLAELDAGKGIPHDEVKRRLGL